MQCQTNCKIIIGDENKKNNATKKESKSKFSDAIKVRPINICKYTCVYLLFTHFSLENLHQFNEFVCLVLSCDKNIYIYFQFIGFEISLSKLLSFSSSIRSLRFPAQHFLILFLCLWHHHDSISMKRKDI